MADQFKSGDIVQLKSGGPAMTVIKPSEYEKGFYDCTWFKGASKENGRFIEASLQTYAPPSK